MTKKKKKFAYFASKLKILSLKNAIKALSAVLLPVGGVKTFEISRFLTRKTFFFWLILLKIAKYCHIKTQ